MAGCMRVAISREWLLRLLKALDGDHMRDKIPDDAEVVDCEYRGDQRLILLTLSSDEVKETRDLWMISCDMVVGD